MNKFKNSVLAFTLASLLITTPACASRRTHRMHHVHNRITRVQPKRTKRAKAKRPKKVYAKKSHLRKARFNKRKPRRVNKSNKKAYKLTARQLGLGTYNFRYLNNNYINKLSRTAKHNKDFQNNFIKISRAYYRNNAYSPTKHQLNKYTHRSLRLLSNYSSMNHVYHRGWISSNPASLSYRPVRQWAHNNTYRRGFNDGTTYYDGLRPDSTDLFNYYIKTGLIKD